MLADEDPKREWDTISDLRSRIAALPCLSTESEFDPLLTRRTNTLAGNVKLTALLGHEKHVAGKIITVIKLMGEIDDSNLKSNLLTLLGHYFELPDFKREFAGSERRQIPALFKAVKSALSNAGHISDHRKSRFEEILNKNFGVLETVSDKRQNDRSLAGPDDVVTVGHFRFKLRNWSPRGLLFAAATPDLRVGQNVLLTVLVRNPTFSINFEAEAEVVRVAGGVVAVQYKFRDRQAEQKVKQYFG
jgi:hypothetical protein